MALELQLETGFDCPVGYTVQPSSAVEMEQFPTAAASEQLVVSVSVTVAAHCHPGVQAGLTASHCYHVYYNYNYNRA